MKKTVVTVAITLGAVVVLFVGVSLIVIFSGLYNVAATSPHSKFVEGLLGAALDASVESHAKGLNPPAAAVAAKGRDGYLSFERLCVTCHGAPGVAASDIGQGLYPPAPELSTATDDLSMQQIYWIVAHGIKDTGMPAFQRTHEDADLWMVASFVKRLSKMTAKDYENLRQGGGG